MPSKFEDAAIQMLIDNPFGWYSGYSKVSFTFGREGRCLYKNGGRGRVDLFAHVRIPGKFGGGSNYQFEIKSCKGDLYSGNGLNLFGMYNYLVYPKTSITSLPGSITYEMVVDRLKEIDCEHAGIIAIISDEEFIVERKAKRYYGDGMPPDIKPYTYKNCRTLTNKVQSK